MTTKIEFFFTTESLEVIQLEVNEWLIEADKKGYLIDDIQFKDSTGTKEYAPSTIVMVRYRET